MLAKKNGKIQLTTECVILISRTRLLMKRATIMCEKQYLALQNDDLSVSDKNAPETQGKNKLKRKTRAFCQSKPMHYSVYYSACRTRGGGLNSPRFFFLFLFFSVSQVGAALMGDTAGTSRVEWREKQRITHGVLE